MFNSIKNWFRRFFKISEKDRPDIDKIAGEIIADEKLWYPKAIKYHKKMPIQGKYKTGYPIGAIIHFTAGRDERNLQNAYDAIELGIQNKFNYMCISRDGKVVQANPLNEWGWHAGKSSWPGLGSSLSDLLVGIEVCNPGKLTKKGDKYYTWYNREIPESEVRYVSKKDNMEPGYYQKYTAIQEHELTKLLLWLKHNNPNVFSFERVLGHDSVAPNRKNDPGGSLSMTIPEYQEYLKKEYEKLYGSF